jgi:ribosome-associated translation inhibitor RaiA
MPGVTHDLRTARVSSVRTGLAERGVVLVMESCMKPDLQIVVRHLSPSEPVLALVRTRFAALTRRSEDIVRCHVDVERAARGGHFRVFVQLTLLGGDVVRSRDDELDEDGEIEAAIDRAFESLASRLKSRSASRWSMRAPSFA